jgi:hypothetical protein
MEQLTGLAAISGVISCWQPGKAPTRVVTYVEMILGIGGKIDSLVSF